MQKTIRLLLASCSLLVLPGSAAAKSALEVGQPAPDFSLPDQTGRTVSLADYRGKWLVLYFYPKDFTPGCTTEAQHFRDAVPDIEKLGAAVIGVSEDSVKNHAKFAETYHLNYTLLADDKGKVAAAYESLYNIFGILKFAKRHTFIIDPQGHIAAIYLNVDPAQNPQQIVIKLQSLMKVSS